MTRFLALAAAAVAACSSVASAAYCGGAPDPNAKPNVYPINTDAPTLIGKVPNGLAYAAGQPGFEFTLLHVYGTAYEMGFAHGSLMKPQVQVMINATWAYMVEQVTSNLNFLPAWLADLIATEGLDVALDILIDLTKPFTGPYIYQELQGLADGAQIDYKTLCRIHLIGELTQGDCSMMGAFGAATASGKTISLRALDWDVDGPFKNYPAVVVYHPSQDGHAFANVGFLGWIGSLAGQSSQQLSIHEIGVSFPDSTHFGNESFVGIPFVFLLRDILQFDMSYNDTINRMTEANRTCDLLLGVGDGKAGTFRGFAVSATQLEVYDDKNLEPWNNTADTWHPRIDDVV
jgi:isopenicillin-N N-acyltransferase-like protein